ncbi:tetratricopeptide repeat protein 17-like [Montipora foliosa]|uniref:tetratricopeptide repeat protein 17-like n=1 Tax=Montipora foliosa TaxID=591990 RepID=UPI0035F18FCE
MCTINLAFYFISLATLYSLPFCKGATHWIVTEDGRIQQQVDSIFNLKSPHDLVTFIHQQDAFERLKILREEYLVEKRKVIKARKKERGEIKKSFYKIDPDCIDAGRHISEFELHLDMTLSFAEKGINIPDHVNLCQPLPEHVVPPVCRAKLPTVIYSYDHLDGVSSRQQLNTSVETTMLTSLSSYFKTAEELGRRVSLALKTNSSSWVLLNLAAYYWRIKGNALEAVECLRQALYFSPREHKDRALMSLAAVLYHANYGHDSIVLLHSAMDTCSEQSVYHFLLGNIYASLKMFEMADLCYRFTMVFSPNTETLCERIKAARCELKLKELLTKRQLDFDEKLDSLKTPELEEDKDPSREERKRVHSLPLEVYKRQLKRIFSLYTRGRTKSTDACKSRDVSAKQESVALSDDSVASGPQTSSLRKQENEKLSFTEQKSNNQGSSKATLSKPGDTKEGKSVDSIEKGSESNEELRATKSGPRNHTVEGKTMENLAEARQPLNCLRDVVKTVGSSEKTAALNMEEVKKDKRPESGTGTDEEEKAKRDLDQTKTSSVESASSFVEKESQVKKVAYPSGRRSRRGESGLKISSGEAYNREDTVEVVIMGQSKLPRQKGESMLMSKNGPGVDKLASKNTREMSGVADAMFVDPEGNQAFGPKHTPPLESKHLLTRTNNCANVEGKKRKGELFGMGCLSRVPSKEDDDVTTQSVVSITEFSDFEIKQKAEIMKPLPVQSDAEAKLTDQTSVEEMSPPSSSSNTTATGVTLEARMVEEQGTYRSDAEADLVEKDDTADKKEDKNLGSQNSKSKLAKESVIKTVAKDVIDDKLSCETSDCPKQHEQLIYSDSKVSDLKVAEKSDEKMSSLENKPNVGGDEGVPKTSQGCTGKSEDCPGKKQRKSELKTSPSVTSERRCHDEENDMLKHDRAKSKTAAPTRKRQKATDTLNLEQKNADLKSSRTLRSDTTSQNVKDKVEEAEFHKDGAGSSVFETSFFNVPTSGSLQELNDEQCKHIEGVQALVIRNKHFSAWLSLDTKNIDVRAHIDFISEVKDSVKKPYCTAKIKKSDLHTFGSLQGLLNTDKLDQVAEAGLTQTLLTMGRTIQHSVDEMGTRIYNALKRNSTSWVLLNIASLYWRVQGDTVEAIKCLQQALYFSPSHIRDVAHVGLASILLREGYLDDTAVVIKKALEISPSLALGHFILGNVFGAQNNIPDAIQHYLLALKIEGGFSPAVERLKIIQCVLWKQQRALEKEAEDLRKLLIPKQG